MSRRAATRPASRLARRTARPPARDRGADQDPFPGRRRLGRRRRQGSRAGEHRGGRFRALEAALCAEPASTRRADRQAPLAHRRPISARGGPSRPRGARRAPACPPTSCAAVPMSARPSASSPRHGQDRPGGGGALPVGQPDRQHLDLGAEARRPRQELRDRLVLRPHAERAHLQWRRAGGRRRCRPGPARPV
jgi:hypothetical protein